MRLRGISGFMEFCKKNNPSMYQRMMARPRQSHQVKTKKGPIHRAKDWYGR